MVLLPESAPLKPRTLARMVDVRIAPGKIVDGRVELDAELPEGASVTVLALEGDETFEADAETEQMLLQAIAQCEKGQTTRMSDLLSELRSRE
jgi:beta-lactam-binding protein with PASTA domain